MNGVVSISMRKGYKLLEAGNTNFIVGTPGVSLQMSDLDFMVDGLRNYSFGDFYGMFDKDELNDYINDFKKLDILSMSDKEVMTAVFGLFGPAKGIGRFTEEFQIPKGSVFYRSRKIESFEKEKFMPGARPLSSEFWEPPSCCVKKRGRLNEPGQSVFYCNYGDMYTTLKEVGVTDSDLFLLMAYEVETDINVSSIGIVCPPGVRVFKDEDPEAYVCYKIIQDFLKSEFSRTVYYGEEDYYRVTNLIFDTFYSFEKCVTYPSMHLMPGINLRMEPEFAHRSLALKGVFFGECLGMDDFTYSIHSLNPLVLEESPLMRAPRMECSLDMLFHQNKTFIPGAGENKEDVCISTYYPCSRMRCV